MILNDLEEEILNINKHNLLTFHMKSSARQSLFYQYNRNETKSVALLLDYGPHPE